MTETDIVNIMVNTVYYALMWVACHPTKIKTKCRERDCTICVGIPR